MDGKMKLYGFNNLTKSLSFNIYDVCYAKTQREQKDYISYIDEQYNSDRLTKILTHVTEMIGAKVLNISKQDYEPQGASVTILVAEGSMIPVEGDTVVAHLDKSHVTVHLPRVPPGYLPCHLPCGYRRGHLRGDHAPFHTGLSHRQL